MKFFPYGSFLDNVIVIGAHVLLIAAMMMLLSGGDIATWQGCLLLVLAIPGLLSFVGGAFEFGSYVSPYVKSMLARLRGFRVP
jgi:hypothetical protein